MNKLKRKELLGLAGKYSLSFFIFALFCVLIFFWSGNRSMMDSVDGLQQRYIGFVSCGNMTRSVLKSIFVDHKFEFPMWDMTSGMGSDARITFTPLATPILCLFSALVPVRYSEYAFDLVVVFRLYLSGLAFILFVYEKGYKTLNAVAGAMVYVFSSTTFIIIKQLGFSSSYILFPLLLLAADRVWKNKKSILYVLILSYSISLSFYFSYMMLILLVAYCLIRFLCEDGRSVKKFFSLVGRFVVHTVISIGIGAGLILPNLIKISGLSRLKTHYDVKAIDFEVIKRFFSYGFTYIQADGDAFIGVSSFVAVAVICLIVSRKKEPVIKWCLSLCLVSFAFPVIGSVFNGFNYSSYRYIFSLILCFSYLVTVSFDSVKEFKGKIWYIALGISALYLAVCLLFIDGYAVISALSLLITVLLTGIINLLSRFTEKTRRIMYLAVIFISCVFIGYTCINVFIGPTMLDSGSVYGKVFENGGIELRASVDDHRYRTDTVTADYTHIVKNSSVAAGISGFDFYHSTQNQLIEDYYSVFDVLGDPIGFSHTGFRCRCYLELLNACNYIARSDADPTCIRAPYSYDYVNSDGDYSLYKADRGVSLVYFYDDVISVDSFMKSDALTRETTLMYSMVTDNPEKPEADAVSDAVPVSYEIDEYQKLSIEGNLINVAEEGGYIRIRPDKTEAGQISVLLKGLKSSDSPNYYFRNAVALVDADNKPIAIDYSTMYLTTFYYYTGNDDIIFSFENIDEEVDSICVIFNNHGKYNLDGIKVFSRPEKQMEQTLDAFYNHAGMEDITYDYSGNHMNISAKTDTDRYLYIAVPYSKGWKAEIDGEPVQIIRANLAFMAVPVSAGTHDISLTYRTPYLFEGLAVSAAGIVLYAGYLVFEKKKLLKGS
ncbi:MAG: YfhO family protein [Clostridiales bacterium]|nr:YfhO family protein [Clostridiales bacterium]